MSGLPILARTFYKWDVLLQQQSLGIQSYLLRYGFLCSTLLCRCQVTSGPVVPNRVGSVRKRIPIGNGIDSFPEGPLAPPSTVHVKAFPTCLGARRRRDGTDQLVVHPRPYQLVCKRAIYRFHTDSMLGSQQSCATSTSCRFQPFGCALAPCFQVHRWEFDPFDVEEEVQAHRGIPRVAIVRKPRDNSPRPCRRRYLSC